MAMTGSLFASKSNIALIRQDVRDQKAISVFQSRQLLVDGHLYGFQNEVAPSSLSGVSFVRVAGQALDLSDNHSRNEIERMLKKIRPGGAFLILGHGGMLPCGAVAAKKKAVELEKTGKKLEEPKTVLELVSHVSKDVCGYESPEAELINARAQAEKIMKDGVFHAYLEKKNIKVVTAVCSDENHMEYHVVYSMENLNGPNGTLSQDGVSRMHPKLHALKMQLAGALEKIKRENISLASHYSHALFFMDPMDMRTVLDPFSRDTLEVGGISCVDARLQPKTPEGPKYLFKQGPNQVFTVTVEINGTVDFSVGDMGSGLYALRHVNGINSLNAANPGNGHIVCLATSYVKALRIKQALLEEKLMREATKNGETITTMAFDGKSLLVSGHGIENEIIPYNPKVNILSMD